MSRNPSPYPSPHSSPNLSLAQPCGSDQYGSFNVSFAASTIPGSPRPKPLFCPSSPPVCSPRSSRGFIESEQEQSSGLSSPAYDSLLRFGSVYSANCFLNEVMLNGGSPKLTSLSP